MTDVQPESSEAFHAHQFDEHYLSRYETAQKAAKMPPSAARCARFYQLIQMLQLSRGATGATLEAGCFRGMASQLMCQYLQMEDASFKGERHFMVDSFEGLSEPIEVDGQYARDRFDAGAFKGTSVKHVKRTLADFPRTRLIRGWIPDVLESLPDQRYRFVHVDVDLYEPTRDCLHYFFQRLSRGGILVCDDYGPWPGERWKGCGQAVREYCEHKSIPFASLDTGNAVIIKR